MHLKVTSTFIDYNVAMTFILIIIIIIIIIRVTFVALCLVTFPSKLGFL